MNVLARTTEIAHGSRRENRWYPVVLVTLAIAISYFDRQTLPVAIRAIQHNIPISDEQFSYLQTAFLLSYAALYIGGGRLLDLMGTRRGFTLIMLWWSIACALSPSAGSSPQMKHGRERSSRPTELVMPYFELRRERACAARPEDDFA